ncbi:MAG: hypothetical protein M3R04_07305 [bacterium]|nr:hypothetical protein [bacterium]
MIDLLNAIGFGIVGIASFFLVFLWAHAALAADRRGDLRYRLVAWGLCIAAVGVATLATNRVMRPMVDRGLAPEILFVAACMLIISKIMLLSSTAVGGRPWMLHLFVLASALWAGFCIAIIGVGR